MAKEKPALKRVRHYVCCECNRLVAQQNDGRGSAVRTSRCDQCGHEMVVARTALLAFGLGIGWAGIIIFGAGALSIFAPGLREAIIRVGLAVCLGLACIRLLEAARFFRGPRPAASISRQLLAEGAGAFVALLIGSAVLFH
jgi:DNA-directed RNA polymerase subunit RPC12/RpoP